MIYERLFNGVRGHAPTNALNGVRGHAPANALDGVANAPDGGHISTNFDMLL